MPYTLTEGGELKPIRRTPAEVLELIERQGVRYVDLQFADLTGRLQHVTIPIDSFDEDAFTDGVPKLDGSSIRGFTEIHESDMVLFPDPSTYGLIPWFEGDLKMARLICNVHWGYGGGQFDKDVRYVAQRAEEEARKMGYDATYWGPEVEFFVFSSVSWDVLDSHQGQAYWIESPEAAWNSNGTNYPIRFKRGYFQPDPIDTLTAYRGEVANVLRDCFGIYTDAHHHEVATAGQCEIDIRFDTLTNMADSVVTYKYVARNVAQQHGLVATFMPKPIFGDNASGMHVHVSLWQNGVNLFYDENDDHAELSQLARYFGGGLLDHSRSLAAIVAPTTNSYRRLVPGYEAPVYTAWSRRNRSACVRVPVYQRGPHTASKKRIEFRPPDPSANPYLCFAAILAAGLDGIRRKIDMGDPVDENIYDLPPERRRELGIGELPGSLKEAVEALKSDHDYLKPIFSQDLIDSIIEIELQDAMEVYMRPHPYEFHLYFDA
jgi:glutamine synthetase